MKDIHRVWLTQWVAILPFLCGLIVFFASVATINLDAPAAYLLMLLVPAIFAYLVIWKSDRIRHFNKTFAEYEENYRYEKEAQ